VEGQVYELAEIDVPLVVNRDVSEAHHLLERFGRLGGDTAAALLRFYMVEARPCGRASDATPAFKP
jgi:hypothetical protein